jgi:hypothetical protein
MSVSQLSNHIAYISGKTETSEVKMLCKSKESPLQDQTPRTEEY